MAASTSATSSSSPWSSSFPHLVRTATAALPMASPIWEEEPPTLIDDDDVPLSFYSPSTSGSSNHHAAGVRRSQTVTAAGSRLHRIGSSTSSTSPGGAFNTHNGLSSSSTSSLERPLSASTGVSRRTSIKATSPSLNRVVEGSTPEDETQYYPSNAYLPLSDDDNQALYAGAAASLARHSSMPVSRAYRRDPNNPGAPWQRTQQQEQQQHSHHHQYPISPPASSSDSTCPPRPRSNSTAAAEAQLPNAMTLQSPATASSLYQPSSPNAPSSPLNSGFVVTSRPNSQAHARNAVGYNQHFSSPMSSAPGHGRSMSSHGWSSTETSTPSYQTLQHSPAHSRHASESLSNSGSSQAHHQLGRVPSNASTGSSHAHNNNTGSNNSNHNSTPSPASPIDTSLLGQNNPWSPTAEERMHFRELSSTLNLATLRPQGTSSSNGLTDGIIESSIPSSSSGPISPPSSKRGSAFKDPSSPRRANSLNTHGRGFKPRPIDEPVPHAPSVLGASGSRQPQRKNTPVLPPLVTSSEALYTAATENTNGQGLVPATGAVNQQAIESHLAQSTSTTRALQSVQNGFEQPAPGVNGAKIIRGPASAAPYVPPIGHTHASDRAAMSPEFTAQHAVAPTRQHHEPYSRSSQLYGHAAPVGLDHINHLRGFTTAGPGIPENSYLQERERITGLSTLQQQQQRDHVRQEQHVQSFSPSSYSATPLSPQTATSLNSAITMQFPSLHNMNNAAALTSNLQLQQHLLAQQTQQLHEQQNQLALALANGLNLQDRTSLLIGNANNHQQYLPIGLPTSPPNARSQLQPNEDPYTIATKIEALQKANAMLVAAMNEQNGQQQHLMQQSHFPHQLPGVQQVQMSQHGVQYPIAGMYGSPAPVPAHHSPAPSADLGRPVSVNGTNGQHQQQRHEGISPVDIHALTAAKGYNPREFDARPPQARFFVIKSFTEDDVFKSIKFEIWSSTVLGNNRLDKAFSESSEKGPIYLFFSVNASGHFCGVAEMLTPLDYSVTSSVWAQGDKWKGVMNLRWIYIKDIPNPALRHLKLMNTNEQKPVTSSRDTQEVPYEQGCEMLHIFGSYQSKTSLLQDFAYYQAQTATPVSANAAMAASIKSPPPAHNGTPAGPPTQAGHPNSYSGPHNRSSTPSQQQQQGSYQHNPLHHQPQQQHYRSRQTAPLKR